MADAVEIDDDELLRGYAAGSESAFRSLVERHSGWVYASATRQLRDAHLAEDATQAVFVLLCQRAKNLKSRREIAGWLFMTLRYTVKSIVRSRRRRERHEKLAALESIAPVHEPPFTYELDAALARLGKKDREAILLRFYQELEFASVARKLGISEEAARKRITRAVGRLRAEMRAPISAESLKAASAFGAPAAANLFGAHVSKLALIAAGGGAMPASVASAIKGATYFMAMTKAKIAAISVIVLLLMTTGVGIVGRQLFRAAFNPNSANMGFSQSSAVIDVATTQEPFEQIYALRGSDVIDRVPPPFSPARMDFYRKSYPSQAEAIPRVPGGMVIYWRNGKPQLWGENFSNGECYRIQDLIEYVLNFYPQNLQGDTSLAAQRIKGDFVIKKDADKEQLRKALAAMIGNAVGYSVDLSYRDDLRSVIVFKGQWTGKNTSRQMIQVYGAERSTHGRGGGGSGSIDDFANWVGEWIGKPVISEATGAPSFSWHMNDNGDWTEEEQKQAHDPVLVCQHIQEQTGLTWTEETRQITQLYIDAKK